MKGAIDEKGAAYAKGHRDACAAVWSLLKAKQHDTSNDLETVLLAQLIGRVAELGIKGGKR